MTYFPCPHRKRKNNMRLSMTVHRACPNHDNCMEYHAHLKPLPSLLSLFCRLTVEDAPPSPGEFAPSPGAF
ncbi:MAG TPA: hypothetical protein PLM29_12280 [Deltaproteobacteria bacterium]|nr:hypothetical protein [Deltaproteobacteria bacterium]